MPKDVPQFWCKKSWSMYCLQKLNNVKRCRNIGFDFKQLQMIAPKLHMDIKTEHGVQLTAKYAIRQFSL